MVYPDNNGSFSKVEIVEQFNTDPVELRYDKAGNLTFDGNFAYTYDFNSSSALAFFAVTPVFFTCSNTRP